MTALGIFGCSGFAREINDVASELGMRAVFFAESQADIDAWTLPDEITLEAQAERYADMPFAIGIGANGTRQRVHARYAGRLRFPNLVHPAATFGKGQRARFDIRQGNIVCAGARFMNGIEIGDFGIYNLNSTIGHDCLIEDFVHCAPGANVSGYVHLAHRCWIGTGACVRQGSSNHRLHVGADTMIGAGAVVIDDCEPHATYVGVPARKMA